MLSGVLFADVLRIPHILSTCLWDPRFHLTAYITPFYSNLESEGLFSNSLPLRWWEVLCHPTGMCKPSIPHVLHPAACKLLGVPSLQIIKIITLSPLYLAFLCYISRSQWRSQFFYILEKSNHGRSMDPILLHLSEMNNPWCASGWTCCKRILLIVEASLIFSIKFFHFSF